MARWVLLGFCLAFGAFVWLQLRPGRRARARGTDLRLREARARALEATDPEARAAALADAGEAAAEVGRWRSAGGLFSRAMRVDPASERVAGRLVEALGRARPRVVETILWRRLGALPEDRVHRAAATAIAASLALLYERDLADPLRAAALRRLEHLERGRGEAERDDGPPDPTPQNGGGGGE